MGREAEDGPRTNETTIYTKALTSWLVVVGLVLLLDDQQRALDGVLLSCIQNTFADHKLEAMPIRRLFNRGKEGWCASVYYVYEESW